MSKRPLPDWQYAHPDGRNDRIRELESQLVILHGVIDIARKRLAKYEKTAQRKKGKAWAR